METNDKITKQKIKDNVPFFVEGQQYVFVQKQDKIYCCFDDNFWTEVGDLTTLTSILFEAKTVFINRPIMTTVLFKHCKQANDISLSTFMFV